MAICMRCGVALPGDARFCTGCGLSLDALTVSESQSLSSPEALYRVTFATGGTQGPFRDSEIKALIAQQRIRISDSIRVEGASTWTPISQTPFGPLVVQQAGLERLASSSCPRCGAGMAVVSKRSSFGMFLIILGVFTSVAVIGIFLILIGYLMRKKVKVSYQCPRCNYAA
jgi:hypothetical protein